MISFWIPKKSVIQIKISQNIEIAKRKDKALLSNTTQSHSAVDRGSSCGRRSLVVEPELAGSSADASTKRSSRKRTLIYHEHS